MGSGEDKRVLQECFDNLGREFGARKVVYEDEMWVNFWKRVESRMIGKEHEEVIFKNSQLHYTDKNYNPFLYINTL